MMKYDDNGDYYDDQGVCVCVCVCVSDNAWLTCAQLQLICLLAGACMHSDDRGHDLRVHQCQNGKTHWWPQVHLKRKTKTISSHTC